MSAFPPVAKTGVFRLVAARIPLDHDELICRPVVDAPSVEDGGARDTLNKWGNQGAGVSKITGFRDLFRVSLILRGMCPLSLVAFPETGLIAHEWVRILRVPAQ